ncbi:MAG TPA: hypothetical protein VKG64_07160, partial [Methylomirabilota bacterium]|nr:hypothetical protein [Methylomirabilota bacterium]
MSRFVVLELGAALAPATEDVVRRATAPVLLRLLDVAPPFRDGQIVHVRPAGNRATSRAILLCRGGGGYHLRLPGEV